jgi:hypothetical protein
MEQPLRMEKEGEMLVAKAKDAMKGSSDINAIAANLGVAVDTISGVTFNADRMGKYSMEMKAIAAIAAKDKTGLLDPIQGTWGVFVVNIDNNNKVEKPDVNTIRMQYERMGQNGVNFLIPVLQNRVKIDDSGLKRL